jgi:PAS domain S-box-containing protein
MDNLPDAIYFKDRESRFVRINKGDIKVLGLSDPAQAVGKTDFDFFTADHARPAYDDEQEIIRTGQPVVGKEEKETWPDGRVTWVSTTKMPLRDAHGNIIGTFGVSRDITERKRMEIALVESERRYRDFISYSHEGVWRVEMERPLPIDLPEADGTKWFLQYGYLAECNLALARLLGYPTENELIGKRFEDLFASNEEMIETVRSAAHGRWQGRTIEFFSLDDADNLRFLQWTEIPIVEDGKVVRVWGMTTDLTEIKKAEAENARLVTAIEQSEEAVVITDTDGSIEYVNPAFTHITGYSREEALGQNPRMLKSGKQDLAFYQQLWATILKGEIWRGEIVNRRKDGSFYTEEMSIAPVRSTHGEVTHYIATKEDVTKRKSLEAQVRQATKMEAVGQLAGGVAHDFNNLLTIISGYGQLLRERLSAQDLGQMEEILKASDRAAALTRQLLAFSRRQILTPQVLDLNSVVANLEKMLRRLIGEHIEFTTVQQSGLGRVKADPGQVEQVIINLAVNARDAMPEGGKLTIETANVDLDGAYARRHAGAVPGPYVMVAVSDTGIGMNAETLAHMFEPFFTTKEKGKGTGLGLATVYGIVKQSVGYIAVYSEPGHGSTFKIYLPRVEEAVTEAESAGRGPELGKGSETVLVAEDEEGVRALVRTTLVSYGYKVLEAREPGEALTIVERYAEPIHLLLTDVVMPHMSGKELAKRLATAHPEAKVLYMSGYTDNAVFLHGVLEAGTFFLQKPFVPSTLLRKVREVLDTKRKDD